MHNLTGNDFLSGIVRDLKMEHKELLYFLSLQKKLFVGYSLYRTTNGDILQYWQNHNHRPCRWFAQAPLGPITS